MSETNTSQRLRLYLIRHGEIEAAAMDKLIGRTDVALSERGVGQARRLAERLSSVRLDAVYSSDLRRAFQTAEIIAEHNQISAQPSAAWREINMGMWEDRALSDLYDESQEQVASLFNDPSSFEYPDGESFADFTKRIRAAMEQLLQRHPRGEVALVAHGGVCRAIIGQVLDVPIRNWLRIAQRHGCLNALTWYESQPMVELLNYSSEKFPG